MKTTVNVSVYDKYTGKQVEHTLKCVKHVQIIAGYLDITYIDDKNHLQHFVAEIDDTLEYFHS